MRLIVYDAHRSVNADQWEQHFKAYMHNTGETYPPEDANALLLGTFYFYWCEGDGRNRWPEGAEIQDMGVYVDEADARDADGATAAEVLAALTARRSEVGGKLKVRYGEAIASLSAALNLEGGIPNGITKR